MRKIVPIALAAITLASPALAALPPAHQRAAELKAVVDAATEALDGAPIVSVEYILEDEYRAYSADCAVTILIHTVSVENASAMPGPRQFEAEAGEPECGGQQP